MFDVLRNPQGVFAQTRQGSEETLRISHLTHLRLRPRSQQTDFEQAQTLVCHYARSPLRGLLAPYGADASIPAPHETKTLRFCLISSLSTRRGGVWVCAMGVWLVLGLWVGFGCVQSSEIVVWDRWKEHKGVFDQNHSEPNNTIVFLYIHYTTFLGNFNILERNS